MLSAIWSSDNTSPPSPFQFNRQLKRSLSTNFFSFLSQIISLIIFPSLFLAYKEHIHVCVWVSEYLFILPFNPITVLDATNVILIEKPWSCSQKHVLKPSKHSNQDMNLLKRISITYQKCFLVLCSWNASWEGIVTSIHNTVILL